MGLHVSPYLRGHFLQPQLASIQTLLSFAPLTFQSVGGTLGLRGAYDMPMTWGVLTPNARVEYRHTIDGAYQQEMNFTDIGPSVTSTLSQPSVVIGTFNTTVGVRARSKGGVSGEVEYGTSAGGGKLQAQTIRAAFRLGILRIRPC